MIWPRKDENKIYHFYVAPTKDRFLLGMEVNTSLFQIIRGRWPWMVKYVEDGFVGTPS